MRAPINGVMMIGGMITSLSFSPNKDKAYVKFKNEGDFVFEFNNKKKPRADHVRKLRLKAGEKVLAIGAISEGSYSYGFGYEIMRDGRIAQDDLSIIQGRITRIIKTKNEALIMLETEEKKVFPIRSTLKLVEDVKAGDCISCMCVDDIVQECKKPCSSFSPKKCEGCEKKNKAKRYSSIEIEKI